jgi:hypothetical protein
MFDQNRFHELISAIQKAIRWCEVNDARWFAKELIDMGVPFSVWGQLRIIAAEDIGIADPSMVGYVEKWFAKYDTLMKNEYKIDAGGVKHKKELCEIIDRVVIAEAISYKSRLLPMSNQITLWDIYKNEKFIMNKKGYFSKFAQALNDENIENSLYYSFISDKIFGDTSGVLREIENKSIRRNKVLINEWVDAYKENDNLLKLTGSIMLSCRGLSFTHGEYLNNINNHLSVPIKRAEIPDRAYDMHTAKGRALGRGLKHFFNVAGTVKNERFKNIAEEEGKKAYFDAEKEGFEKGEISIKAIKAIKEQSQTKDGVLRI